MCHVNEVQALGFKWWLYIKERETNKAFITEKSDWSDTLLKAGRKMSNSLSNLLEFFLNWMQNIRFNLSTSALLNTACTVWLAHTSRLVKFLLQRLKHS